MKQEKTENKTEQKKSNTWYVVIAAVLVVLGVFAVFSGDKKAEPTKTAVVQQTASEAQKPAAEAEKVIARIDLSTKLTGDGKPQFEVYLNGADTDKPLQPADWMNKFGTEGYVVQQNTGAEDVVLKAAADADISIILRGVDKRGADNKIIENWVKYTTVTVDGKEILPGATDVWHNAPFKYVLQAKAGNEYKIHAEWTKSDK